MNAGHAYLETQIATATPQRLRLMLIDGALRRARQTAEAWAGPSPGDALEPLIGCRSIVAELIAGIREGSSPLADKVLGIYLFLFRELTEAQLRNDVARVGGVIRVLEEERITWQEVCATLGESAGDSPYHLPAEVVAPAFLKAPIGTAQRESVSFDA
ncbi:MAG: flagellar protein FliS [Pirellulaceae bacterium]|nr:flagellar protein FliS [Pirellulaceae bacterium]